MNQKLFMMVKVGLSVSASLVTAAWVMMMFAAPGHCSQRGQAPPPSAGLEPALWTAALPAPSCNPCKLDCCLLHNDDGSPDLRRGGLNEGGHSGHRE